jgi:hypothetical protein
MAAKAFQFRNEACKQVAIGFVAPDATRFART